MIRDESVLSADYQRQQEQDSSACCAIGKVEHQDSTKPPTSSSSSSRKPYTKRGEKQQQLLVDDATLAKEMNELSVEEREKVYDDIHGVAKMPNETPEFLGERFRDMDAALESMLPRKRKTLNRAWFLCPKLEADKDFKLMFLRADLYNGARAAERMIKYYDLKHELFGDEKLVKQITVEDLDELDVESIRSRGQFEAPFKDPSGRPVLFSFHTDDVTLRQPVVNVLRGHFYMVMAALRGDDTAQKLGVSSVVYCCSRIDRHGNKKGGGGISISYMTEMATRFGHMTNSIPCRYSSARICYDDPAIELPINALRAAVTKFTRLRISTNLGSVVEHEYFLKGFGLDSHGLIEKAAQGSTEAAEAYFRRRVELDAAEDAREAEEEARSGLVLYPKKNDVLIGRGASYNIFQGNARWEQLIQRNVERYAEANNFEKTCMSIEMVKTIQETYRGRFLQRTSAGWKLLEDSNIRDKAARAFRTRMKSSSSTSVSTSK